MISLVVARARNGVIGKDNTIPWHAPEDLAFFQRETIGGAIIMGRNTWDSLPFKPLKGRMNIVVSSRDIKGVLTVRSIGAAIQAAQDAGYMRIYGIGGSGIYSEMLGYADRLLITEVDLEIADADAFFPELGPEWSDVQEIELRAADPKCVAHEWVRASAG